MAAAIADAITISGVGIMPCAPGISASEVVYYAEMPPHTDDAVLMNSSSDNASFRHFQPYFESNTLPGLSHAALESIEFHDYGLALPPRYMPIIARLLDMG